jgi:hypothetical protein
MAKIKGIMGGMGNGASFGIESLIKDNNSRAALANYNYSSLEKLLNWQNGGAGANAGASSAISDSISKIAGGQRQLIVNINAPMNKDTVYNVGSMAEARQESEGETVEQLTRIFKTVSDRI